MSPTRARLGAVSLAVAAVMFVLYPALRPWHDESTTTGAIASMSSAAWPLAHFFAVVGFVLTPLGLLAIWGQVRSTPAEPLALAAAVTMWISAGLVLPFYGAEAFGLHAIGARAAAGEPVDLLGLVDDIHYGPIAVTTFGAGLIGLGVGSILGAVAIGRAATVPRLSGVLPAIGFALYLPQFFTPAGIRIGHGVLLGAGLAWLALGVWRSAPAYSVGRAVPS